MICKYMLEQDEISRILAERFNTNPKNVVLIIKKVTVGQGRFEKQETKITAQININEEI